MKQREKREREGGTVAAVSIAHCKVVHCNTLNTMRCCAFCTWLERHVHALVPDIRSFANTELLVTHLLLASDTQL